MINSYIHPFSSIVIYPSFYIYIFVTIHPTKHYQGCAQDLFSGGWTCIEGGGGGMGVWGHAPQGNFDHGPLKRAIWHNLRINVHFISQYLIYEHLVVKQCNYNRPIDIILLYIHCESTYASPKI